jgi:hypothetical protein
MTNPDITQKERREILENDRKVKGTYMSIAEAAADELAGGRFAQTANKQRVIGTGPIVYPAQPENSPWRCDPCGIEPPLGFSVNDQPAVGEPHEVRASSTSAQVDAEAPPPSAFGDGMGGGVNKSKRRWRRI